MERVSRRHVLGLAGGVALAGTLGFPAPAGAATAWRNLGVVTANIGRANLDQRKAAITAVRNALDMTGPADRPLVGWQEIGGGDGDTKEKGWINELFGERYRNVHLNDGGHYVPISVPRVYDVLDERVTPVHEGLAGVSVNRVISEFLLAANDDAALQFAFLNTHFVAGAFNGQEDPHEAWRRSKWALHFDVLRERISSWQDRGYPVIWTGDINRNPMPKLFPAKETRAFDAGIDQIGWLQGSNGVQIQLRNRKTVPMHVDGHDARVAVLQLRRA
ncbi:hypothetical protein FHU28_001222 [Micromonospora echinospora]|uniref:Endonuclease/exonuclease/phosphatase family protein n=1 Tax=Micromonospora echinospora TaxID=1877 RepID=A0ABR6M7L8_MICEC|nr:hypothetical protein [Micromonospora echinospora]MBB5111383.1 hypothetical protein [Micromonospora echinospora]